MAGASLITLVPLVIILSSLFSPQAEVWAHLTTFVLPRLLSNTAILLLGVSVGVLILGVPLAWLVALYQFPGRQFFSWALMLPLAMPAYVMAFTLIGLLDYTGPLQSYLRTLNIDTRTLPNIRSTWGVLLTLSLTLYPYVYLLAREGFSTLGRQALEAGQSLGLNRYQGFFRLALPMNRPWIIGGLSLALMETLADFGTVAIFNYDAFTSAIYKAWFGLFSLSSASQLASILVLAVFCVLWIELRARGKRLYIAAGRNPVMRQRQPLRGWKGALACLWATLVFLLAFAIPFAQLVQWSILVAPTDFDERYVKFIGYSIGLAALAAGCVTLFALMLSYAQRREGTPFSQLASRVATLGYAVPGTVLAVGIFIPIAWLDQHLLNWLSPWLEPNQTALLKGTLWVMLLAYVARFSAVGFQAVDSAMQRITRSQEESARALGCQGIGLAQKLYFPLLRGGLLASMLMVFVDVMKEMPITLMTRPFGWDTLAIRVFEMTSEGEWERAALPAVAIVLSGLLPVILLARSTTHPTD